MPFKKAERSQSKLRLALFGPAGSGKTYSAIAIAHGLLLGKDKQIHGKIALADSERGSASKYAGKKDKSSGIIFQFDSSEFEESKKVEEYIHMIKDAKEQGYDVLIIDSLTHAWDELLEENQKIAQTRFRGNTWAAWQEGTPKQRKLIDAILSFPGHIIATMRSKTEWEVEKDMETGKNRPKRIGLKPQQGKEIEYEFDTLIDISTEHLGTVLKDRICELQDQIIEKPGVEFGQSLIASLNDGVAIKVKTENEGDETPSESEKKSVSIPAAKATSDQVKNLLKEVKRLKISPKEVKERLKKFEVENFKDLKRSDAEDILEYLKGEK